MWKMPHQCKHSLLTISTYPHHRLFFSVTWMPPEQTFFQVSKLTSLRIQRFMKITLLFSFIQDMGAIWWCCRSRIQVIITLKPSFLIMKKAKIVKAFLLPAFQIIWSMPSFIS
ncbi:hypothetical protein HETIRDRAFT_171435 [Heterobasidion irregulare TC 32-1]|uniref:Uncharacterized protein n=1 Tax=Heterobasidion irregulare (strain TC 32-1) TaxID=747525 RepID=W4K2N3_HETIT|nr:uncharacterized protein HETIRDRAFT_171435 [Heterobasidion irregulare TC 32-1]ETW80077.1 hypothetical protein HETIRDRAFT_171435 [Heterobasidion irregulare TC 32-1]